MKDFTKLREGFSPIMLEKGKGQALFFSGEMVQDEEGNVIPEGDGFINIAFSSKNHLSRILSNLFPYKLSIRDESAESIEGILQSIKHKEADVQKLVMQYSGLVAWHTRGSTLVDDWRKRQTLNWKEREMKRDSEEYQLFLDEVYLSAFNNPLYKKALQSTGDKILLHTIGHEDAKETVLTRNEYESRLNALKKLY